MVLRVCLFIICIFGFVTIILFEIFLTGIICIPEIISIFYNLYYSYLNIKMMNSKLNLSIHSSIDLNIPYQEILNSIKTSAAGTGTADSEIDTQDNPNSQVPTQGPNPTQPSYPKLMDLTDVQRTILKNLYNLNPKGPYFDMVDLSSYFRASHTDVVSYTPLDQHQHTIISGIDYANNPSPQGISCRYYITIYNNLSYFDRLITVQDLFITYNKDDYLFKIKELFESGSLTGYTAPLDDNFFNPFVVYPDSHPLFKQFNAIHDFNQTLDIVTEYSNRLLNTNSTQIQDTTQPSTSDVVERQ